MSEWSAAHCAEFSISVVYDFVVVAHHSITTAHHTLILFWVEWAGHTAIYHVIVLIIDTFLLSNDFKHLHGIKVVVIKTQQQTIFAD